MFAGIAIGIESRTEEGLLVEDFGLFRKVEIPSPGGREKRPDRFRLPRRILPSHKLSSQISSSKHALSSPPKPYST